MHQVHHNLHKRVARPKKNGKSKDHKLYAVILRTLALRRVQCIELLSNRTSHHAVECVVVGKGQGARLQRVGALWQMIRVYSSRIVLLDWYFAPCSEDPKILMILGT